MKTKLVRDAMIDDERSKTNNDDDAVPALDFSRLSPTPDLYQHASHCQVHCHFIGYSKESVR